MNGLSPFKTEHDSSWGVYLLESHNLLESHYKPLRKFTALPFSHTMSSPFLMARGFLESWAKTTPENYF
jgi:hypothetical protein